ncbi:hypothetical protein BS78_08G045500 [Paspalum vaginatum]|uniref:RNase H type-1 domain-containing protein n=1 Tax=Paspalum vaginatum TaxID=158149 RepID=A0A9W8CCP6_9POAL|nr:hypothetical protein BS78_K182000 [Paspalum vaginatum]KAJ1253808.1 hypothetical protein BS78_K182000 [Paspalum vaginatum]KAJ1253809.1 hypothetical protein BS78_K182000 [Paspalum vaginatum]KAJ1253810.1 hypothetical protein BS78_K182000 [Paspalum vaginatum]KAJ1253811.1 hypothetical protein BS78_K182000 [Paspalum vaginatum]
MTSQIFTSSRERQMPVTTRSQKTADLSIMIWKNDQVVHSETFLDVPYCFSTIQSEVKAAFAILVEAKKHGIENLLLWVDNKRVAEVILGKWQIDIGDRNRKLFMALRSLRRSFKRLIVTCVPRELLQITDGMLRECTVLDAKAAGVKSATFVKSANRWTYHLNAMPLFDISMTPETVDTIKKFGKPKDGEPQSNKWYIEVPEGSKVSALQNIMETLSPSQLYVAVQHVENKQRLLQELYTLIGNVVPVKINSWSVFLADSIGSDITGKRVMVVFDGFYLEKELERASDFIITLSKPEERRQLSAAGFQELSASCYIYYHGACSPTM